MEKEHEKIVLAFDSFKGSLSSIGVGEAAARGVRKALPGAETVVVPVADGGEGTVEAVVDAMGGEIVSAQVSDPLGNKINAGYGISGDTAIIEMAAASGLPLVPADKRNPWVTTSFGTGELIRDALLRGCRRFLIGIGGSATNDAGTGMLRALGFRFLDCNGVEIIGGGGAVGDIVSVDCTNVIPQLSGATFTVACDVTNPLTGPDGASHVYGPQKGADPGMVEALDRSLASFAKVVADTRGGVDLSAQPGAGAAGGLGFAFLTFLGATLEPGVEMVLDAIGFDSYLHGATLVLTGEGRLDSQTPMGKTPAGVLRHATRAGINVIAVGGSLQPSAVPVLIKTGFKAVFPVIPSPMPLEEALLPVVAAENVERTVEQIIRTLNLRK
ncbi:MAG: glycerate kinase [Muribaculaceae bacterium]|nr:glycerate kinase [Muribaculaceae bacterium]